MDTEQEEALELLAHMDGKEDLESLGSDSVVEEEMEGQVKQRAVALKLFTNPQKWIVIANPGELWTILNNSRSLYFLCFGVVAFILGAILFGLAQQHLSRTPNASLTPFTGAFARFPRISQLPERQKRLTIIGAWNDDTFPSYLRHFFYTIQLNADVLDLVMINRKSPNGRCLDFEKEQVNITWGGNIRFHCMDSSEWDRRHADFLCSAEYGWNCNATEYEDVLNEYQTIPDPKNVQWRPLCGHVFRDLFPHPENPLWAWLDHDLFVGNFARYPFNVLSQLSMLTGSQKMEDYLFLTGQLTAFNLDDENLGTAWKKFPPLKSATHFTKHLEGKMPQSSGEGYWSYGYLRTDDELPGSELSYGIYPDMHGDDYYHGIWNQQNSSSIYVISGRDILLVSESYTRENIENLIRMERNEPVDDLGSIGWTGGEDGSEYLLEHPDLGSEDAKRLAVEHAKSLHKKVNIHRGVVEDIILMTNTSCTSNPQYRQCIWNHPLTLSGPPLMRASLLRFKEQRRGHLLRRLERDQRHRGYERKLIRHHLFSKKMDWFQLPPFDISEDLVLRYNSDVVEVFKMGLSRDETLFFRKDGEAAIG